MSDRPNMNRSTGSGVAFQLLRSALRQVDFLADVPSKRLKQLAEKVLVTTYQPGQALIQQGEYGHTLFVLLDGAVEVSATDKDGSVIRLKAITEAGAYFGEQALLGRRRREATVTATATAMVVELDKTTVERLDLVCDGAIFPVLTERSDQRSIREFLTSHRFLGTVNEEWMNYLVDHAQVEVYERGATLYSAGEIARSVFLMKSGIAKLQRATDHGLSVLSYFSVGDLAGIQGGPQSAALVSMGYVEVLCLPRDVFAAFADAYPELVERFKKEEPTEAVKSATVAGFVDDFLGEGAQEGLSLLTINLDKCVRCGNCVQSCEARHGHARFTRRGKTLVRRKDMEQAGVHETLLIPSSCRHCVNPECMVGCPTGAIHRRPGGEVDIEPYCIGCGSCATRCPYDNITMVPTPGRLVDGFERDMLANKCNLCAGYDGPNCVNNCPTGAIIRIEPTAYFQELVEVVGRTGQVAVGQTRQSRDRDLSRWIIPGITALIALALGVWSFSGADGYTPWSVKGMTLGVIAFVSMLGAGALAARRRMNRFNTQLGRFLIWTRAHICLGFLFLAAVVFHSQGNGGGAITTALLAMTGFEIATGIFGAVYYKWLPKVITRIEGDAQVEEDVRTELAEVQTAIAELSAGLGDLGRSVASQVAAILPSGFAFYRRSYVHDEQVKSAASAAARVPVSDPSNAPSCGELAAQLLRERELNACLNLYAVRKGWLLCHIGVTALLMTLTLVHIGAVLYFWGGFGS